MATISDTKAIRKHLNLLNEDSPKTLAETAIARTHKSTPISLQCSLLRTISMKQNGNYYLGKTDVLRHFFINARVILNGDDLTSSQQKRLALESKPESLFATKFNQFANRFIDEITEEIAAENVFYLGKDPEGNHQLKSDVKDMLINASQLFLKSEARSIQAKVRTSLLNQHLAESKPPVKEVPLITLPKKQELQLIKNPTFNYIDPTLFMQAVAASQPYFAQFAANLQKGMLIESREIAIPQPILVTETPALTYPVVPEKNDVACNTITPKIPLAIPAQRAPQITQTNNHSMAADILKVAGWVLVGTAAALGLAVLVKATCGLIIPLLGIAAANGQAIASLGLLNVGVLCLFANQNNGSDLKSVNQLNQAISFTPTGFNHI